MTKTHERLAYAVAWSALAVPLICTVGYAIVTMRRGDLYLSAIAFACLITFVIGWPSAFVSGALIALIFGKRVIEGDWLASIAAVLLATACGYFGVRIVWTYYNDLDGLRTMTIAGTIAGFVSGVCFCYLARLDRERSSRGRATPPSPA